MTIFRHKQYLNFNFKKLLSKTWKRRRLRQSEKHLDASELAELDGSVEVLRQPERQPQDGVERVRVNGHFHERDARTKEWRAFCVAQSLRDRLLGLLLLGVHVPVSILVALRLLDDWNHDGSTIAGLFVDLKTYEGRRQNCTLLRKQTNVLVWYPCKD